MTVKKTQVTREKSRVNKPPVNEVPDRPIGTLLGRTENQSKLLEYINNHPYGVVAVGPPGTGKTYIPAVAAANMLRAGTYSRLILCRPNVASGPELGFRPGSLEDKLREWFAEILYTVGQVLGKGILDAHLVSKKIELVPFESMRGRSFENCFIFLDEAQNTTISQILNFLFRAGDESFVFINGDVRQCDLRDDNGLAALLSMLKNDPKLNMGLVEFGLDDIVRSGFVKHVIQVAMEHNLY